MKSQTSTREAIDMLYPPYEKTPSFGQRLRQIRKEQGLTQEEFGKILGIRKQQLSRYELDARSPRAVRIQGFARNLNMSVGELLGSEYAITEADFWKAKGKPFYQIFDEVVYGHLGLSMEEVVVFTGLDEGLIRNISTHKVQVAPLGLALVLESTLNIPVEVWVDKCAYSPSDISVYGFQLVRAYMQLDDHYKAIVSTALYHKNGQTAAHPVE